jgi:hypothetical protein
MLHIHFLNSINFNLMLALHCNSFRLQFMYLCMLLVWLLLNILYFSILLIEFKKWMCYIDGQKNKYSLNKEDKDSSVWTRPVRSQSGFCRPYDPTWRGDPTGNISRCQNPPPPSVVTIETYRLSRSEPLRMPCVESVNSRCPQLRDFFVYSLCQIITSICYVYISIYICHWSWEASHGLCFQKSRCVGEGRQAA